MNEMLRQRMQQRLKSCMIMMIYKTLNINMIKL